MKSDPERATSTWFIVAPAEAGLRADTLVGRHLFPSTAAARRAMAAGLIGVDGRGAKKSDHLQAGQRVELAETTRPAGVLEPTPELVLPVLYADAAIVAVAKPSGIPSHPLRRGDGATVASALVARYPECGGASPDPREGGLGHRLDIGTSGVIVAARSREVWHRLREVLSAPSCEKVYAALAAGSFPGPDTVPKAYVAAGAVPHSWVVECPIGRRGRRGAKVVLGSGRQPLPARTEVILVEPRAGSTLVEARLAHGRAHQVRAHLAYLGIPVLGDTLYNAAAQPDGGLHLHARSIAFVHPTSRQLLRIEAPLPAWARRA
ncbi:MAG: RluA family pseudouridine synthase [Polyangia bacterium]